MLEVICKKCGKIFVPAPQHVYKGKYGMYCSWTCYNHRNDDKQNNKRKYKYVEVYDRKGSLFRKFESANDAAEYTGYDIKHIQAACRCGVVYNGFIWRYSDQ